VGKRQKFRGNI